jgi:hypothetical protein
LFKQISKTKQAGNQIVEYLHFFITNSLTHSLAPYSQGLAGIVVGQEFSASSVVITDLASHVPHIQKNIFLNPSCNSGSGSDATCRVTAEPLDWTNADPSQAPGTFDVILALEWCASRSEKKKKSFVSLSFLAFIRPFGLSFLVISFQFLSFLVMYCPLLSFI